MRCRSLQAQRRTVKRLAKKLESVGIHYALIGGMALEAHGRTPRTENVAFLLQPAGLGEFQQLFVPKYYLQAAGRRRTFVDQRNRVVVRFAVSGTIPGAWPDGLVPFPDPAEVSVRIDQVNVADYACLIQINLAARGAQALADAVEVVKLYRLDDSFAEQLHASLRPGFMKCLDEVRREDEFNARED